MLSLDLSKAQCVRQCILLNTDPQWVANRAHACRGTEHLVDNLADSASRPPRILSWDCPNGWYAA
jgi:hypothetical protein